MKLEFTPVLITMIVKSCSKEEMEVRNEDEEARNEEKEKCLQEKEKEDEK